ncbi:uncharacterized protein LOC106478262 [Limulus polyphemus]|uniref:Uncharacterized protein LOC106478262 n=1 Tax=Limulus polyphemus TaxID=6850 RepID=A0ABM1C4Y6_LIMPO|nr:uncharacterized protein LOC106478262 [Limulus polyphemus]
MNGDSEDERIRQTLADCPNDSELEDDSEMTSKEELVEKVFPNIQTNYKNHDWLSERAILAAKNKDVYELNNIIQSNIQSEAVTYKSVDTVVEADETVNYPTEFLNSLDLPGMPPHVLQLKIGVPIIMLRNINQPKLCNGTRLAVKKINEQRRRSNNLDRTFQRHGMDILYRRPGRKADFIGVLPFSPTATFFLELKFLTAPGYLSGPYGVYEMLTKITAKIGFGSFGSRTYVYTRGRCVANAISTVTTTKQRCGDCTLVKS